MYDIEVITRNKVTPQYLPEVQKNKTDMTIELVWWQGWLQTNWGGHITASLLLNTLHITMELSGHTSTSLL